MHYTKTHLPSGLGLITVPVKGTKTVTILVMVRTGSKYETKEINGISHFLEHMFFKGTEKRPTTKQIAEELDSVGGEFNAFTSKEFTGYYAKASVAHFDLLLDVISDIFLHSKLDAEEVEREKGVILEEFNMYLDTPARYVDDLFEELLYGNQPQGWKVIGEKETIQTMSREKLKSYVDNYYVARNSFVVVAGDLDKVKSEKLKVKSYFKDIRQKREPIKKKVKEWQSNPQVFVHYKETDQTHLVLGVRAYSVGHKDLPILKLLSIILGGNMSSRLFINIRERQGLCYYISSHLEAYTDCGYLAVKAGVDNKRVKKAITLILKELQRAREEKNSEQELNKAKEFLKGRLLLSLETPSDLAFWLAGQEAVERRIKTPEQIIKEIERVKVADIARIAKELFINNKLNLAVIGPYRDSKRFEEILWL
jgi:predicted Zn-dependent peptidase